MTDDRNIAGIAVSRRRLLEGAGLGLAGLALPRAAGAAGAGFVPAPNPAQYVLQVKRTEINPDGEITISAITVNDQLPSPELRFTEGNTFQVRAENHLPDEATTIHWHGMLVPDRQGPLLVGVRR